MHFTKSQIEEIARRLAVITKRDSELPNAVIPLDDSERVPIIQYIPLVQDYENRLLSLADLRSLVLADKDQTAIGCMLNVVSQTDGVTVYIKGQERTSYAAYYGEMVDVVISKEGYDAWFGVITMTQDHTLTIRLNENGGSPGPGPGPTPVTTFDVTVHNTQGATIKQNGVEVQSGETKTYPIGTTVRIDVEKDGYVPQTRIVSWTFDDTINLDPVEIVDPYLRFSRDTLILSSDGGESREISIESNVSWVIETSTLPDIQEDTQDESQESISGNTDEIAYNEIHMNVGDTMNL